MSERTTKQLHQDPPPFVVAAVAGLCREELIDLISSLIPPGLSHESGVRSLVKKSRQNNKFRLYDKALAACDLLHEKADAIPKDPNGGLSDTAAIEWLELKRMAGVQQRKAEQYFKAAERLWPNHL
jgi:hypothetical protein